jgi:ABC-type Zn uptake system ZnuABC Zn-binding protein ZnuA
MRNPPFLHKMALFVLLSTLLSGCSKTDIDSNSPQIAVTNSYLQCVVKDLSPNQTDILCLTPPGMCPGHFDISPGQVQQLCNCKILLLFDVQKKAEESLSRAKGKGLRTALVTTPPGLCVPEAYLTVAQQVCDILSEHYPQAETKYRRRLSLIEKRLNTLSEELLVEIRQSELQSAQVLASHRQQLFCNWLGLQTVATFVGSDVETVSNINQCLQQAKGHDIKLIVANKQEGTALARALAGRIGATAVVFSNFPAMGTGRDNFDRLLRENIHALFEAVKK